VGSEMCIRDSSKLFFNGLLFLTHKTQKLKPKKFNNKRDRMPWLLKLLL
jgi:hypothetical protein